VIHASEFMGKGLWVEFPFLCQGDNVLIAFQLCHKRLDASGGKLIIDAPLIIHFGIDSPVTFPDQTRVEHPLERAVERAGAHTDFAIRIRFDLLHDSIAVTFSTRERQQYVEHGWSKGGFRISGCHTPMTISATDIFVKEIINAKTQSIDWVFA